MKNPLSPLQTIIHEHKVDGWDIAWKKKMTGWDLGGPTRLLVEELKSERERLFALPSAEKEETKTVMKTLIPGCGSGYDLLTVANHHDLIAERYRSVDPGLVVGLDISETSIGRTKKMLDDLQRQDEDTCSAAKVELVCDDFFTAPFEFQEFTMVFDYTFFCAIHPSLRENWGKRMGELIKTGGQLITFAFPIVFSDKDMSTMKQDGTLIGPPFPVTVEEYKRMLEPNGFEMVRSPEESDFTEASRQGKELVIWWKKVA